MWAYLRLPILGSFSLSILFFLSPPPPPQMGVIVHAGWLACHVGLDINLTYGHRVLT